MVNKICDFPWTKLKVNSQGDVMNCCWQNPGIGNIFREDLNEVWNNRVLTDIRNITKEGKFHRLCSAWGTCPFLVNENLNPKEDLDLNYTDYVVGSKYEGFDENAEQYKSYPDELELDLPNTHCNIGYGVPSEKNPACIMCARNSPQFVAEYDRLRDVCIKLEEWMEHFKHINIQGYAEPFYKDIVFDSLDWLNFKEYKKEIFLSVINNGMYFNRSRQKEWVRRSIKSNVQFSIDAASEETYVKVRRANAYKTVFENIYLYNKYRDKSRDSNGRKVHMLTVNNNINILNVHECVKMVEDAAKWEVDFIQFGPTDRVYKDMEWICVNDDNRQIFVDNFSKAKERADELGVDITFVKGF